MTSIKISTPPATTSTTLSNVFIDHFMPPANGEFVKVYLYLFRMSSCGQAPTIADMADALNNTESDILRALKYWQKEQLLTLHYNDNNEVDYIAFLPISGNRSEQTAAPTLSVVTKAKPVVEASPVAEVPVPMNAATEEKASASVVKMPPKKPNYDTMVIASAFSDDTSLNHLEYEAEILVGHPLSQEHLNTLYYIHDKLNFSADLMSFLLEYCVSNDKKSIRYMEKVAISWHEHGITDPASARTYCANFSKTNTAIKRALGLQTWGEEAANYARTWSTTYGIDLGVIVEACNRAYKKTGGENALNYANAIIESWHKAGIYCLPQLEKQDAAYQSTHSKQTAPAATYKKNAFHNFDQGEDIDYDAILPKVAQPLMPGKEN